MPNTYSQIYLHFVFAVSGRRSLIPPQHKIEIHKYITGIIQRRKAKLLAIHCMTDHIHIFSSLLPTIYTPDFVRRLKFRVMILSNQKFHPDSIGRKVTECFHMGNLK
jgi:putative transposase